MSVNALPDDATVNAYTCDGGLVTTLVIPSPTLAFRKAYKLECPSPGGTVGPTSGNPATDATIVFKCAGSCPGPSVGGVAGEPGVNQLAASNRAGGDSSATLYVAGGAAGVLALVAVAMGTWYVRRRGRATR